MMYRVARYISGLRPTFLNHYRSRLKGAPNLDELKAAMSHVPHRNKSTENERLVWVDLEMTGLDLSTDQIIEMACIISDGQLNVIAEGPNLIIHQPDELMDTMDDWCKQHHGNSGLTKAVRESKISLQEAESQMFDFIHQHTPPGKCLLAGNSVHADKVFLDRFMPRFMKHLHYRIIDVSSVKEIARRWYPEAYKRAPSKAGCHRALSDIRESIKELQYYRQAIFK